MASLPLRFLQTGGCLAFRAFVKEVVSLCTIVEEGDKTNADMDIAKVLSTNNLSITT
jgi:hypothetical protein